MKNLCSCCAALNIDELLRTRKEPRAGIQIGSLQDITKKSHACSFCFLVMKTVQKEYKQDAISYDSANIECQLRVSDAWQMYLDRRIYNPSSVISKGNDGLLKFSGQENSCFTISTSIRWTEQTANHCFGPVPKSTAPRATHQFCQRLLRPEGIDFDLVRRWYRLCRGVHGQRCSNPKWLHIEQPVSLKLVNVMTRSVVLASPDCRYAALSYVWGTSGSQVVLGVVEHEDLANRPFQLSALPKVIENALQVTKELGLEFLWVDALCIPQIPFNNPSKDFQLRQMDRIYKSAEVCILATGSTDVNDPIPGVHTRRAESISRMINGRLFAVSQAKSDYELSLTEWNHRAWTYQERMLARRSLALDPTQAYWTCQCDEWCESAVLEPADPGTPNFVAPPLKDTSQPPDHLVKLFTFDFYEEFVINSSDTFSAYEQVVQQYSQRRLGRPEDGLNAIAGFLKVLQKQFGEEWSTLHFGLPEAFFDMALLWVRKTLGERPNKWKSHRAKLPSWSWTGWMSNVGIGVFFPQMNLTIGEVTPPILPAVQWYIVDSSQDKKSPGLQPLPGSSSPSWLYKKRGLPCGIDSSRLVESPPSLPPDLPSYPAGYFLQALTTTITLYLGPQIPVAPDMPSTYDFFTSTAPYQLLNASGTFAGIMVLSEAEVAELHQEGERDEPMEFVFLSYNNNFALCVLFPELEVEKEFAERCPPELARWAKARGKKVDEYSVVNAMWVKRCQEGYCERKLLASVLDEQWLACRPKTEWVLIG